MAALVGWFGLSAGSSALVAQDYPAADQELRGFYESETIQRIPQPLVRKAARFSVPFQLPEQPAAPETERETTAPVAFNDYVGFEDQIPTLATSLQPTEPAPPTPPRRNPLFRDPADVNPEPLPGRGPLGTPVPGFGPDDLYLPDDDQPFVLDPADDQPLGVVGRRMYRPSVMQGMDDFYPIEDRWRLGFPEWNRYLQSRPRNPWSSSVIKGDYPLWGTRDKFFQFTGFSDSFYERREVPNAAGKVDQTVFQQTVFLTFDLFRGDNFFHPSEWFFSITPAYRYQDTNVAGAIDFFTIQQGFLDYQLAVNSDYYDTTNLRVGRQAFASDFRNFVFADTNDAVRLFGTDEALRTFWNVLYFATVQKDATALNTFDSRQQQLVIANLIRQDFVFSGFNGLAGFHYDNDSFLNKLDAFWLELAGNGRIGRFGVSAAFVQALGHDDNNPVAKRSVNINAQLAALEVTMPTDWWVPRASVLYASGDQNPTDGIGRGFDSIFDNPNFAGGGFSYLNRENIVIGNTRLSNAFSFLPSLRAKAAQPSNFVNPGLVLYNLGLDGVLSTRWQAQANVNYYQFVHPEPVEALNPGKNVGRELGYEASVGLLYRPLIVENVICTFGGAVFEPGAGITGLNGNDETLWTLFTALTAVY